VYKKGVENAQISAGALLIAHGGSAAAYIRDASIITHYAKKQPAILGVRMPRQPRAEDAHAAFEALQDEGTVASYVHTATREKYQRVHLSSAQPNQSGKLESMNPSCILTITRIQCDLTHQHVIDIINRLLPIGIQIISYDISTPSGYHHDQEHQDRYPIRRRRISTIMTAAAAAAT